MCIECEEGSSFASVSVCSIALCLSLLVIIIFVFCIFWMYLTFYSSNKIRNEDRYKENHIELFELHNRDTHSTQGDFEQNFESCILFNDINVLKTLGKGQFGHVFEGTLKSELHVAVKYLKVPYSNDELQQFLSEIQIMKRIGEHKNIIKIVGDSGSNTPPFIVMELAENGNLQNYLRSSKFNEQSYSEGMNEYVGQKMKIHEQIRFAHQIATGMEYLKSVKCIHRDLAARNILLTNDLDIKISDFGLAIVFEDSDYYHEEKKGMFPLKWMAPESLILFQYSSKSDVWSFGIVLWEIMTLGRNPYEEINTLPEMIDFLKKGIRLDKPMFCPYEIYLLMRDCWHYDSVNRPDFSKITNYLNELKIEELLYCED